MNAKDKKYEDVLRAIETDVVADLMVVVDTEGRFIFVNAAYCRMFGKTWEELVGQPFMPLVHEEDRGLTEREMRKLWVPPHMCFVEQRAMTVDGWRWLAWSDTGLLDENGKVVLIIGIGRDITRKDGRRPS